MKNDIDLGVELQLNTVLNKKCTIFVEEETF